MKPFFKNSKYVMVAVLVFIVVIAVGVYLVSSKSILSSNTGTQETGLGSATPPLAGIYFLLPGGDSLSGTSAKEKEDLQAFQNPSVDGIYLRDDWADIEPTEGTYDWSYIDSQVATADAAHKKIEIGIRAGTNTPNWVYTDGAKQFNTITLESAQGNFCQTAFVPVPWDPIFLAKWTGFINAFAAHYANNPNVVAIKLSGIDITTEEIGAPQETGETISKGNKGRGGETCKTNDDVSEWIADGYTGQKMLTAWQTIVNAYATAFPRQYLGIMTSVHSFPPINFSSSTIDPSDTDLGINYFLPASKQILGDRFVVGQNGARPDHLDPGIWNFATSTDTHLGWQPSWPIASCFDSTGKLVRVENFAAPCDMNTDIEQLIKEELSSNPTYLEFMTVQLTDTNPQVQQALQQAATQVEH